MTKTTFHLIAVGYYIFGVVLIVLTLSLINKNKRKKYNKRINEIERAKNLIISASILSELNKVEALINNDILKDQYNEWKKRFSEIKDIEIPKITDDVLEIEDLFNIKKYKDLDSKMAKVELRIYNVKIKADFLLEEIKSLTLSEERNRETVITLKRVYREILNEYNKNKIDYKEVIAPLELQFENVDKLFSSFELAMENNSYTEVGKIVKALDDTIGNLRVIIEEAPSIILMGKGIIPKKIKDIASIEKRMIKDGYQLDYLNIEYNINESKKKISDIFARLNVLNVEDSIFELKTMLDYFDSIYNDFDKERISRKLFDEYLRKVGVKSTKLARIVKNLILQMEDIKYSYDLSNEDIKIINEINNEIKSTREDYEKVVESRRTKLFAYSKLAKEMEILNVRLAKSEDKLDVALRTLGSLKDDELRAREQLDEIKDLLKEAKDRISSYKLPVIPQKYYIEIAEANDSIKEIVKELEKKPISIKILNTRVDTARDLVLKFYATTKEIVKAAKLTEMSIVYGNRYRPINKDVDFGLTKAENLFFKGNFRGALENAINAVSIIEPDFIDNIK